jgi:hypothetical protein
VLAALDPNLSNAAVRGSAGGVLDGGAAPCWLIGIGILVARWRLLLRLIGEVLM